MVSRIWRRKAPFPSDSQSHFPLSSISLLPSCLLFPLFISFFLLFLCFPYLFLTSPLPAPPLSLLSLFSSFSPFTPAFLTSGHPNISPARRREQVFSASIHLEEAGLGQGGAAWKMGGAGWGEQKPLPLLL